ncbi:hypothetical protein Belba_2150 [Belliella baltica DSM 15883]|uniref:Uncharacterized protein n=1 Tax=Belliella baltica (strain DSM 15883 / CIP 108006 / LMG 21964 / BA134) TaxID=866536 RepID=I3Z649_BELBD|nr:DUF5712 family protein [Belliella baltica]AFL84717.1 hypothetical protein Belba_2150 [Belliella baltica DSM 15883]
MIITFGSKKYPNGASNKGSCRKLAIYLEKENEGQPESFKRHFFSFDKDSVKVEEVIGNIDKNIKKLGKDDSKYYLMNICPSQKELLSKPNSQSMDEFLMNYTRNMMDLYAKNFNKGLSGKDIMYYAKIEDYRYDEETGKKKYGLNHHVHVIISRKDISQKLKLSPRTNHRNSQTGVIRGGFDRCIFFKNAERMFDSMTRMDRTVEETFEFRNAKKKERNQIAREARMVENPKVESETRVLKGLESKYSNIDWSLLFPPEANTAMYEFEEEEMIRKKKKRDQGMSM